MSLFTTPDWEPNVIGDKRSKDLFNLGTINKRKLKGQLKKRNLKEKMVQSEDKKKHKQDRKWDKKKSAFKNTNLSKQERLPLIQNETQDKQKIKIKRKTKVQITSHPSSSKADKIYLKNSNNQTGQNQKKLKNQFNNDCKAENSMKNNSKINKFKEKLMKLQVNNGHVINAQKKSRNLTLRQKMMERLKASRFRFLNESMYTSTGKAAENYFQKDPDSFRAYHDGFKQQVSRWPLNPLDIIIKSIKQLPQSYITADFGCGDARLAQSVKCKVHSFDLIAVNEHVTACNMANVPLENESVDMAVFCLSLMGTNLKDYIIEANRVLKMGGVLKIVEVESRFGDKVEAFIKDVQHFGFSKTRKDLTHSLFYFMDFKKSANCKQKQKLPDISLLPCLYKKR